MNAHSPLASTLKIAAYALPQRTPQEFVLEIQVKDFMENFINC
jgi:hypothetical protein